LIVSNHDKNNLQSQRIPSHTYNQSNHVSIIDVQVCHFSNCVPAFFKYPCLEIAPNPSNGGRLSMSQRRSGKGSIGLMTVLQNDGCSLRLAVVCGNVRLVP
jgi:hypothetical protein